MISDTLMELCKELDQDNIIRILKGEDMKDGYGPGVVGPNKVRGSDEKFPTPWKAVRFPGIDGLSSIVCTDQDYIQQTIVSMIATETAQKIVKEVNNEE